MADGYSSSFSRQVIKLALVLPAARGVLPMVSCLARGAVQPTLSRLIGATVGLIGGTGPVPMEDTALVIGFLRGNVRPSRL